MSTAVLLTVAMCWKQSKCPPVNEWIKKLWYIYTMEYTQQKERTPTLCDSMDGTGEHYAKWNKPGGEKEIPYDLTYKWNLFNNNKKASKIQPETLK